MSAGREVAPVWNIWLQFPDTDMETEFRSHRTLTVLLRVDFRAHLSGLVQTAAYLFKHGFSGEKLWEQIVALLVFVAIVSFAIVTHTGYRRFYERHRTLILCVTRSVVVVTIVVITPHQEPPAKDVLSVTGRFLSGTAITSALFLNLSLILPFKTHCIVAALQCVVGVGFAKNYCSAWFSDHDRPIFDKMGNAVRHVLLSFGLGPRTTDGGTCISIFSFMMVFFALALSSVVLYILELHSRIGYLAERDRAREAELKRYGLFQSFFACLFLTVFSQILWVLNDAMVGSI